MLYIIANCRDDGRVVQAKSSINDDIATVDHNAHVAHDKQQNIASDSHTEQSNDDLADLKHELNTKHSQRNSATSVAVRGRSDIWQRSSVECAGLDQVVENREGLACHSVTSIDRGPQKTQ